MSWQDIAKADTERRECIFLYPFSLIPSLLRIRSHLLKKFLMENFIFCAVLVLLFCISWCSDNITVRNNKKMSKRLFVRSQNHNFEILSTWFVNTCKSRCKSESAHIKTAISGLFYLLYYNMINLKEAIHRKDSSFSSCHRFPRLANDTGWEGVGVKNYKVWHWGNRGRKMSFSSNVVFEWPCLNKTMIRILNYVFF